MVKGMVADNNTLEPIQGVRVGILGTTVYNITDKNGNFTIKNISLGAWSVQAQKSGYEAESLSIDTNRLSYISGKINRRDTTNKRINIYIKSLVFRGRKHVNKYDYGGTIKGTVRDRDTYERIDGANLYILGTSIKTTTKNGECILKNMPTGTYSIKVKNDKYESQTKASVKSVIGVDTECNFKIRKMDKIKYIPSY